MAETDTKQIIHTPAVTQKQGVERAFLSLGQPRILRQAGAPLDFFSEAPSGFPWTPPPPSTFASFPGYLSICLPPFPPWLWAGRGLWAGLGGRGCRGGAHSWSHGGASGFSTAA